MARAVDGGGGEDGTGETVLVVDDDQRVADLYARWIEDAGDYAVRVVHDGTAAVDAVDGDDAVDAVLVDHDLPEATGEEVLSTLRDRGHDLPAAMVTVASGDAGEADVRRRLTKPVMREDVAATVATLLGDDPDESGDGEAGDDEGGLGLVPAAERDDGEARDDADAAATGRETESDPAEPGEAVSSDVSETLDDVTDRLDRIRKSVGDDGSDDVDADADSGAGADTNAEAEGGGGRGDPGGADDETDLDTVFGLDVSAPADERGETGPPGESDEDLGPGG